MYAAIQWTGREQAWQSNWAFLMISQGKKENEQFHHINRGSVINGLKYLQNSREINIIILQCAFNSLRWDHDKFLYNRLTWQIPAHMSKFHSKQFYAELYTPDKQ